MQLARSEAPRGLGGSAAATAWARELPRECEGARAMCGTAPRLTMGPEMASGGRKSIVKRVSYFRALFFQHSPHVPI